MGHYDRIYEERYERERALAHERAAKIITEVVDNLEKASRKLDHNRSVVNHAGKIAEELEMFIKVLKMQGR